MEKSPVKVLEEVHVTKIVSGSDHLAMLSSDGQLWTMGNSEQGQLGRVNEKFAHRGGRRGLAVFSSQSRSGSTSDQSWETSQTSGLGATTPWPRPPAVRSW